MNYEIVYDIDYAALYEIVRELQERYERDIDKNGSYLQEAVHVAGDHVAQEWLNISAGKFKHSEGGYARGIVEGIKYPFQGDPLYYKIEHTKDYAKYLEHGFEPFDMKKALQTSDKVRISKDGKRYLVIPFEHGTPGTKSKREMPQEIYAEAKRLKPSVVAGKFNEGSIRQATTMKDMDLLRKNNPKRVQRNSYEWGEKLTHVKGVELEDDSHYKNMVRFETNPNVNREKFDFGKFGSMNETSSMKQHSLYMTFRVMIEDSEGWIHPGLKPMRILGETYDSTKQSVEMMLAEAAKKDIARILPNAT
ncbi:MAG: hypothetical protein RDU14_16710 [Melioribacteraceae bacterium]|nr:hypothetical protein [Melioribacteraceae bacterium]